MSVTSPFGKKRRDMRWQALGATFMLVGLLAWGIEWLPGKGPAPVPVLHNVVSKPAASDAASSSPRDTGVAVEARAEQVPRQESAPRIDPHVDPLRHQQVSKLAEIDTRFRQAIAMLHAGRHAEALVALDRVLALDARIPEAHVNRGYALLGLGENVAAFGAFETATELQPAQANAYYGIAIVQEREGNLEGALGGMRTYLHLSQDKAYDQIHVARARSAIWEWEAQLGRGPWGPTKGVPPGFTADELVRDGRGVGIKMPLFDTIREDGSMDYEIKAQDKFQLFRP